MFSKTITFELDDIPADLAEASVRRQVPVVVEAQWDDGCYRLRLTSCIDDVEWPEEMSSEEIERDPDYQILANSDYDGGWNWGSLADEDTSRELLREYAAHQRILYPELKIVVDEMGIG